MSTLQQLLAASISPDTNIIKQVRVLPAEQRAEVDSIGYHPTQHSILQELYLYPRPIRDIMYRPEPSCTLVAQEQIFVLGPHC